MWPEFCVTLGTRYDLQNWEPFSFSFFCRFYTPVALLLCCDSIKDWSISSPLLAPFMKATVRRFFGVRVEIDNKYTRDIPLSQSRQDYRKYIAALKSLSEKNTSGC